MAMPSVERTPPCSFGCWGLSVMAEKQGNYEKALWRGGYDSEFEPWDGWAAILPSHASCFWTRTHLAEG